MTSLEEDAPEPELQSKRCEGGEIRISDARDLLWRLVGTVEAEDFAAAVTKLQAEGNDAIESGRLALLDECGTPATLGWYGISEGPSGGTNLGAAFEALRQHSDDAEVRALAKRLELGLQLQPGTILQVPLGEEAGTLPPFIRICDYWERPHGVDHWEPHGWWESFHADQAYDKMADMVVIRPGLPDPRPSPVILWLGGNALVNGRAMMWGGCFAALLQNKEIRDHYFVCAPLLFVDTGIVHYTGQGFRVAFNEDALWSFFTHVLRKLGPQVDPSRLYCMGISLGAQGVWRMAVKYGKYFAAFVPVAGQCNWTDDMWTYEDGFSEEVLDNITHTSLRAYQTDDDDYAGNPKKDMETMAYHYDFETRFQTQIAGLGSEEGAKARTHALEPDMFEALVQGKTFPYLTQEVDGQQQRLPVPPAELRRLDVDVRKWTKRRSTKSLELWLVKGPLYDLVFTKGQGKDTSHVLHYRVFRNPLWGLAGFLRANRVDQESCWRFDDPPFIANSKKHRRWLDELWGPSTPATLEGSQFLDYWRVTGGVKEGGILVRSGQDMESPQEPARLSHGALVKGLQLHGQRLLYELRRGRGPVRGWVSTLSSKGKELLVKVKMPEGEPHLNGVLDVKHEETNEGCLWVFTRQLPDTDEIGCTALLSQRPAEGLHFVETEEHTGTFRDLEIDLRGKRGSRVRGRLNPSTRCMEDVQVHVLEQGPAPCRATWEDELMRLHGGGGFRIYAAESCKYERMINWHLGSQYYFGQEKRSPASNFLNAHKPIEAYAVGYFELEPASAPDRFKIKLFRQAYYSFILGNRYLTGWYLCAANERKFFLKDQRDSTSTYVCLQNPSSYREAADTEWQVHPGSLPGTYKLQLHRQPVADDWVEGFWLSAQTAQQSDWRTANSVYACVNDGEDYEKAASFWEFEPGSSSGLYKIKLNKGDNMTAQEGFFLSAPRQIITDKRSDDSTFVCIVKPLPKKPEYAEWELEPVDGEKSVYRIKLHSMPGKFSGPGWYLGAQLVNIEKDWRNNFSLWVSAQDPAMWPRCKEAEWELLPTDAENVYTVRLKRMPHRLNRSGAWLNVCEELDKDKRGDLSIFPAVFDATPGSSAASCDWYIMR